MSVSSVIVFNIIESGIDGASTTLKIGTIGTRGKGRKGTVNLHVANECRVKKESGKFCRIYKYLRIMF